MKTQPHLYHPIPHPHTLAAWQGQLTATAHDPLLGQQLAQRESTLFPQFAAHYQRLAALPRRVRRSLQRKWKRSLAGVALLIALGQGPAHAGTTIPVPAGNEAALIQAIESANSETGAFVGADTIVLPDNSTFTLTAVNNNSPYGPTGLPVITSEITIQGNGSTIARSTATGTPEFRLLAIGYGGNLTLQQTTITGGDIPDFTFGRYDGGGIANYGGTVTLTDSTVSDNGFRGVLNSSGSTMLLTNSTISDNDGVYAGGIANRGTMTLTNSTISNNDTLFGGGISNDGTMTLINSTISGNGASYGGGGISNHHGGSVTLIHSTVSGNWGDFNEGGGIYNSGTLTLSHTLISGNTAAYGAEIYNRTLSEGTIIANDYNLLGHSGLTNAHAFSGFTPNSSGSDIIATSDGNTPTALGNILQVDNTSAPMLQDNGGLTETIALVEGGPAIDAVTDGSCPPPTTDQRGAARPVDGDNNGTTECDIGAFEFGATVALGVTLDIKPGSGVNPINPRSRGVIAVAILSTQTAQGEALTFDATQVDPGTLAFGPQEASARHSALMDVDGDGDPDLLLHFRTQETGIACGDTAVSLTGKTFNDQAITGTDSIETVGCKKGKP